MRKYFILASAALALASCSSDDFIGNTPGSEPNSSSSAIMFDGGMGKITRADVTGKNAAELLGNKFYVLGTKGTEATDTPTKDVVFDNYQVGWKENSAGTTDDNTNDWNYVGTTMPFDNNDPKTAQTIKFWDYSQSQYDFIAYSVGSNTLITTGTPSSNNVLGSKISTPTPNAGEGDSQTGNDHKSFTIKASSFEDLKKCYFTDIKTIEKANYGKPVQLTFKNVTAKVRIAFYETIPGYSVSDIEFYNDANTERKKLSSDDTQSEISSLDASRNVKDAVLYLTGENHIAKNGEVAVTYPVVGSDNKSKAGYNKAVISVSPSSTEADKSTTLTLGTVNYTNNKLATTAKEATMAGTQSNNYYTDVLPASGLPLTLRMNYTLTSDDGTNEKIYVYGASAVIPASYTNWQPNTAYTYIFKISDNTNGSTGKDNENKDVEGLFPITFDAVVAQDQNGNFDYEHESITTVSTPSVTSYAYNNEENNKGIIKAYGVGNEYPASTNTEIYFSVSENGTAMTDLNNNGKLYTVSKENTTNLAVTEADVIDALQIQASNTSGTITGRNGLKLTPVSSVSYPTSIPTDEVGKTITVTAYSVAEVTANATASIYAYAYKKNVTPAPTATYIYSQFKATGSEIVTDDTTYYTDSEGKNAVTVNHSEGASNNLTKDKYYYKRYTNNNNVYGVKVVKTYVNQTK